MRNDQTKALWWRESDTEGNRNNAKAWYGGCGKTAEGGGRSSVYGGHKEDSLSRPQLPRPLLPQPLPPHRPCCCLPCWRRDCRCRSTISISQVCNQKSNFSPIRRNQNLQINVCQPLVTTKLRKTTQRLDLVAASLASPQSHIIQSCNHLVSAIERVQPVSTCLNDRTVQGSGRGESSTQGWPMKVMSLCPFDAGSAL